MCISLRDSEEDPLGDGYDDHVLDWKSKLSSRILVITCSLHDSIVSYIQSYDEHVSVDLTIVLATYKLIEQLLIKFC